jgi:hypothetical protein
VNEDEKIREVREEEERRGRRPVDLQERKKRERVLRGFREALLKNDRALFKEIIVHDLGYEPGSPEYENAWREWKKRRGAL